MQCDHIMYLLHVRRNRKMADKLKTAVLAFFGDRMNLKRAGMTVFGVFVCALSVGFFNCSMFGADPFQ